MRSRRKKLEKTQRFLWNDWDDDKKTLLGQIEYVRNLIAGGLRICSL